MQFSPSLIQGTFIKRYKRFLADIRLKNGKSVTAHCANSGSMLNLLQEGRTVYLSKIENPKAKLDWRWELLKIDDTMVGVNTFRTNKIAKEAILQEKIPELGGYKNLKCEVKYAQNSRIDILLEDDRKTACYVEVKNCTLSRKKGLIEFPDAVTARGTKHLNTLEQMVRQGHRAVMLYVLNRTDACDFTIAQDIDRDYYKAFLHATNNGVEAYAYTVKITEDSIVADKKITIHVKKK